VSEFLKPLYLAEAQRLHEQCHPPEEVRDTAKESYLQQLKQAYNAGILTRSEYERKVRDTQKQKSQAPGGVAFDAQQALELLKDIPRLIERATPQERLALVKSLFDRIWVENRRIAKLTPRADVGPVIAALVRVLNGVPDGARTRNILIHSQVLCH
jgi:site-specific DNA recombinase